MIFSYVFYCLFILHSTKGAKKLSVPFPYKPIYAVHSRTQICVSSDDIHGFKTDGVIEHTAAIFFIYLQKSRLYRNNLLQRYFFGKVF